MTGRSVRRGPADGLRPASWSGTGPWPARVGGTGALRRNGDLFANSVRTCGPAGCWGSSPGRLYLFSPLPLPSPWSVLFPAPIPGGALETEGPMDGGSSDAGRARRRAAAPGTAPQGPDGPKRFNRHHHIGGRCHLDLFKMLGTLDPDVHRPGYAPVAAFVASRTAGGRRASRPGPGGDPHATGGGHQVPQRRSNGHFHSLSSEPSQTRIDRLLNDYRPLSVEDILRFDQPRVGEPLPTPGTDPARPVRYREPSPDTALAGRQYVVSEPARGRTNRIAGVQAPFGVRSGDSRRESVRTWRRWRCVGLLPPG